MRLPRTRKCPWTPPISRRSRRPMRCSPTSRRRGSLPQAGTPPSLVEAVERIQAGLAAAVEVLQAFRSGAVRAEDKAGAGPVTEADRAVDAVLARMLPTD